MEKGSRVELGIRRSAIAALFCGGIIITAACSSGDSDSTSTAPLPADTMSSGSPEQEPTETLTPTPQPDTKLSGAACTWEDKDGLRQKPLSTRPLTLLVDGRCYPDTESPVGVYPRPTQETGTSVDQVFTGEKFVVECVKQGEPIADGRGASSRSTTWAHGITEAGKEGDIPEVWLGYVDNTVTTCDKIG